MPHDRPSDGPPNPSPGSAPGERKLAPDLARGFMLLLIAMAYAGVYAGGGFGTDLTDEPLPDRLAGFLATLLLDNRAFPMFAILFGYGLGWMVARQTERGSEPADVRRLLRRRGLFLLLFGAVHAFLVFPGEILTSYGLATLVTGWLLFRSNRVVVRAAWILAGLYACAVPVAMLGMVYAQSQGDIPQEAVPGYTTAADWVERAAGVPFAPLFIAFGYPLLLLVVLGYRAGRSGCSTTRTRIARRSPASPWWASRSRWPGRCPPGSSRWVCCSRARFPPGCCWRCRCSRECAAERVMSRCSGS